MDFNQIVLPDKYRGYETTVSSVSELVMTSLMFGTMAALLYFKIAPTRSRGKKEEYLLWIFFVAQFSLLFLSLGRQHFWLPIRKALMPFNLLDAPNSASVAILYPNSRLDELMAYFETEVLTKSKIPPIDLALRDLKEATKLKSYFVEGDFFRHEGFRSVVFDYKRKPQDFL